MSAPAPPQPKGSFWQRRLVRPVRAQLVQGITPEKIAATLALGTVCSLFPFLGFTSLLNLAVGLALRLNQPILQTLNQLLGPLQLLLILPYVRGGELLWREQDSHFTLAEMLRVFQDASLASFLRQFGWAGVHAFTAWLLSAPLLAAALYFPLRPLLQRTAARLRPASVPTVPA
jgi:uncharacterized protein (DUF2062 family)